MKVYKQMRWPALLLWALGGLRLHKDGDGVGAVFQAWHPLTWLVLALMVIPCALMGERLLAVVPLRLTKFWRKHRDQLQRVTPFTDLSTLKPFKHRPELSQGT